MTKPEPRFVRALLERESDTMWINGQMERPPVPPQGSRLAVTLTVTHEDGTIEETTFHNVFTNPGAGDVVSGDVAPVEPSDLSDVAVRRSEPPRFRLLILGRLLPSTDEDDGGETHRTIVIRPKGDTDG